MPPNSTKPKYVIGDEKTALRMEGLPVFPIFHEPIIDYLDDVSRHLLSNHDHKQYPDVITFGFWCRKASINSFRKSYANIANRLGKGIVFHIAPSNVAINFAYSLVVGMLAGNANIVRLPSKEFEQVKIVCDAFKSASNDIIGPYVCLVQYDHCKDINDFFSGKCDIRIIWGGNQTVEAIRKSPLKPRATDITFPDRYSFCLINADEYLKELDKTRVAQDFYNDTYLTDQNACTSPRLVAWIGDSKKEARDIFWKELSSLVKEEYLLQPIQAIEKYSNMCKLAATEGSSPVIRSENNSITRIEIDNITSSQMDFKGNSGYFFEYEACSIIDILPLCTSGCQTLSYYGIDPNELSKLIMASRPMGIDRIVPVGRTMDFDLVWDGYDLIRSLSREVNMKSNIL